MSLKYNNYLNQHMKNVAKGYEWIESNLPDILANTDCKEQICRNHDLSKIEPEEYHAYDEYFYGKNRQDPEVELDFKYAWLHHIHNNPHHWQYWILHNDEPGEGTTTLDMPYRYIVEMICDWWAFSWQKDDLYEIFSWYDAHKDYMKLSINTRATVEYLLNQIRAKLDEMEW